MIYNQESQIIKLEQNLKRDGYQNLQCLSPGLWQEKQEKVTLNVWMNQLDSSEQALKEKECLDKLNFSKNVVKCYQILHYKEIQCSVLAVEYSECNLRKKLDQSTFNNQKIKFEDAFEIVFQLSHVLIEMQAMSVLHYYMKPSNVLILFDKFDKPIYKLQNFTLNPEEQHTTTVQLQIDSETFKYMSPEQFHSIKQSLSPSKQISPSSTSSSYPSNLTQKMNIFSMSLIILQVVGYPLDQKKTERIRQGIKTTINISDRFQYKEVYYALEEWCLCQNPNNRINSYELDITSLMESSVNNDINKLRDRMQRLISELHVLDKDIQFTKMHLNRKDNSFILDWQLHTHLKMKSILLQTNMAVSRQVENLKEIGLIYALQDRIPESIFYYTESLIQYQEKNVLQRQMAYIKLLYSLAQSYEIQKSYYNAIMYYKKAYDFASHHFLNSNKHFVAKILYSLAWSYYNQNNIVSALAYCSQSINIFNQRTQTISQQNANRSQQNTQNYSRERTESYEEKEIGSQEMVDNSQEIEGREEQRADSLDLMGFIYYQKEMFGECVKYKEECLRIRNKHPQRNQLKIAYLHFGIAKAYEKQQIYYSALPEYEHAKEGFISVYDQNHYTVKTCQKYLDRMNPIKKQNKIIES